MAVSSNSTGFKIPARYMLVLQTSLSPNTDSNSNPNLLMGRISTINQKKKEKREQFAAGRVINLIIDLTQANRLVL